MILRTNLLTQSWTTILIIKKTLLFSGLFFFFFFPDVFFFFFFPLLMLNDFFFSGDYFFFSFPLLTLMGEVMWVSGKGKKRPCGLSPPNLKIELSNTDTMLFKILYTLSNMILWMFNGVCQNINCNNSLYDGAEHN